MSSVQFPFQGFFWGILLMLTTVHQKWWFCYLEGDGKTFAAHYCVVFPDISADVWSKDKKDSGVVLTTGSRGLRSYALTTEAYEANFVCYLTDDRSGCLIKGPLKLLLSPRIFSDLNQRFFLFLVHYVTISGPPITFATSPSETGVHFNW